MRIRTTAGKRKYRWEYQELRFLVYALTQPKDFQESLNFFLDLHTTKEMTEIIRRLIIASLLKEEKTYDEISATTGAARNTIAKVQQKLLRQKSVTNEILKRTGSIENFLKESTDTRDAISRKLDRLLTRASFGLYQPPGKK